MKRSKKITLVFLLIYLACWIGGMFGSSSLKPYFEFAGGTCVLLWVFLSFLEEKIK